MAGESNQLASGIEWASVDFWPIIIVLIIIVVGGLIGGYTAYLASTNHPSAQAEGLVPTRRATFLLLGFVAAACVPLFLAILQSDLIDRIFDADRAAPFAAFLVLLGFCLIAAFSARTFIDSVSRRVLRDLEDVKQEQEAILQKVEETAELVDDQKAEPIRPQVQTEAAALDPARVPFITEEERRALDALSKTNFRTSMGIAADIGMSRYRIGDLLDSLVSKGLVERTVSPATRGQRWKVTATGIAALYTDA